MATDPLSPGAIRTTVDAMAPARDEDARRLMDLEVKVSFMDDLVEQLNDIVARQGQQIDRLVREVLDLRRQQDAATGAGAAPRNLRDELPPHY
jgi:SlyX protein